MNLARWEIIGIDASFPWSVNPACCVPGASETKSRTTTKCVQIAKFELAASQSSLEGAHNPLNLFTVEDRMGLQ